MAETDQGQPRRVLITGGAGFVAAFVVQALEALCPHRLEIIATAQTPGTRAGVGALTALDVRDAPATAALIAAVNPTHVVHLAGIAAPSIAGADPDNAWAVNLGGTLNVARALLAHAPAATLIFAGSGLVYGDTARSGMPLTERDLVAPNSDYGATKAAADLALGALVGQGLRAIRCRPFNHTGPGQTEQFVLPSFAAQVARIERGEQAPVLQVGNLDAERDFLDVRDVADAYARCVVRSDAIAPGTIFNIASGVPVSIRTLLDDMIAAATVPITISVDPARWRANDMARIVGDASLARAALGWEPRVPARVLTQALLTHARRQAAN